MSIYGPSRERVELTDVVNSQGDVENHIGEYILHNFTIERINDARIRIAIEEEQAQRINSGNDPISESKMQKLLAYYKKIVKQQPPNKAMMQGFESAMMNETPYVIAVEHHEFSMQSPEIAQSYQNGLFIADRILGTNYSGMLTKMVMGQD